jgi:FkbM family methyltransferase
VPTPKSVILEQSDRAFADGGSAPRSRIDDFQPTLPPAPLWVRLLASMIRLMPAGRYRLIARLRLRRAAFVASIPVGRERCAFTCDLRDPVAREVCFTRRYEPQETAVVRAVLQPGMTFLDVGANWGYFTLLAAKLVGASGAVVALEPDPRLFPMLTANLARNRFNHVRALPVAAAAQTGILRLAGFDENLDNWGDSRLVENNDTMRAFRVETRAVDDLRAELYLRQIDLVKIDVEGAEGLAIRGMRRGLANHRYRRILLELHPAVLAERGETPQMVVRPLLWAGYRAWQIDHTPAAIRRAAYSRSPQLTSFLKPVTCYEANLGEWPHMLWLAPGVREPWL